MLALCGSVGQIPCFQGQTGSGKTDRPGGGHVFGDPNIKKWAGKRFGFCGICDLVMLQNTNFTNGLDLDIHIRS